MEAVLGKEKPRPGPLTKVGAIPVSLTAVLPFVGYLLGGGMWHWLTIALPGALPERFVAGAHIH